MAQFAGKDTPHRRWYQRNIERERAKSRERMALRLVRDHEHVLNLQSAAAARRHALNPEARWKRTLAKHGLTAEAYWALFKAQGGTCAICQEPEKRRVHLDIDHDHASGLIRGLLCHLCNKLLGFARDNPATLTAAIGYLAEPRTLRVLAQEV